MINIKGFDKAKVLAALYNHSKPQGMGYFHYTPADMTREEAQKIINECKEKGCPLYFDYLKGRVMKVDLSKDSFDETLYDRDNGPGAALIACYEAY
jgi:hypothetical protein